MLSRTHLHRKKPSVTEKTSLNKMGDTSVADVDVYHARLETDTTMGPDSSYPPTENHLCWKELREDQIDLSKNN